MKLVCEVTVFNRLSGTTKSGRSQKNCMLAIGKNANPDEHSDLFMLLFTPNDKTGTRYKVTGNLKAVFTRCIDDGKATISLVQPEHDLQIRCKATDLKFFMKTLKLSLTGKHVPKMGAVTGITYPKALSAPATTKLVITKISDLPTKGLPKSLTTLHMLGIRRTRFDSQILFLKQLVDLDLTDNQITSIPKQLGQMRLSTLKLCGNRLGDAAHDWKWLEGVPLQSSLKLLDLARNAMQFFPIGIVRLNALHTLQLETNQITHLPFAMRRMNHLRDLNVAHNTLGTMPHTIQLNRLLKLDVTGNPFAKGNVEDFAAFVPKCPNLVELAARVVYAKKIMYDAQSLPRSMVTMLLEAPMCVCGRICYRHNVYQASRSVQLRAEVLISHWVGDILCDSVYCSLPCFRKYSLYQFYMQRMRELER